MFVCSTVDKKSKTYRIVSILTFTVVVLVAFSPLLVSFSEINKSVIEQKSDGAESMSEAPSSDAMVQAIKVDLDKRFIFVKSHFCTNENRGT